MKFLKTIINYICYCGIDKNEYKKIKKDAYISNFKVWRVLHCFMIIVFAFLSLASFFVKIMETNRLFYLIALGYSIVAALLFLFVFKKDSLIAQFAIYLSISLLFLFACFITKNKPNTPAATFIVFLLIAPMFMIDKPYFMSIELTVASIINILWMKSIKPYDIWQIDLINIIAFTLIGIFIHIMANSIRIKEFVLERQLERQRDYDELTGIKNKASLTREINAFFADSSKDKGILFMLDIDRFKSINDNFGHDIGDVVIRQVGALLDRTFTRNDIVGRFGGDEFIVFIKDTNEREIAEKYAQEIIDGALNQITLPDPNQKVSLSIGIARYHGTEKNYSDIFKKADIALYKSKAKKEKKFCFYQDAIAEDNK